MGSGHWLITNAALLRRACERRCLVGAPVQYLVTKVLVHGQAAVSMLLVRGAVQLALHHPRPKGQVMSLLAMHEPIARLRGAA